MLLSPVFEPKDFTITVTSPTRPPMPRGRCSRSPRPTRRRQTRHFLKGPVPMGWLRRAHAAGGAALAVALEVRFWHGITGTAATLTLSRMGGWGVSRAAARRGLQALVAAGLVTVSRKPGQASRVTPVL
jgi:hypothetical protein